MPTDVSKTVEKIQKSIAGKAPVSISTGGSSPEVWRDRQRIAIGLRQQAYTQGQFAHAQQPPWTPEMANAPGGKGPSGEPLPPGAVGWGKHGAPLYNLLSIEGFLAKTLSNWLDPASKEELDKYPQIPYSLQDWANRKNDVRQTQFLANPDDPAARKGYEEWKSENRAMLGETLAWGLGNFKNLWARAENFEDPALPAQALRLATRGAGTAVNFLGAAVGAIPQAWEVYGLGPDFMASDKLVREKYKERGWDEWGNGWIKYFRSEADWGPATSLARIGGSIATVMLLNAELWKGEVTREEFEQARAEVSPAGRIAYTSAKYPERVAQMVQRVNANENEMLVADELEDPNAEMMGQLIFDPINILSIPLGAFRAARQANKAAQVYGLIADPELAKMMEVGLRNQDDFVRASARLGEIYKGTESGIVDLAARRGAFTLTSAGKIDHYGKRASTILGNLFGHTNGDPDAYLDVVEGLAKVASPDEAVRIEGLRLLADTGVPTNVLFSPAGNETAVFMRDLLIDAEGKIGNKKLMSLLEKYRGDPGGMLQALTDLNAEQLAKKFPTIGEQVAQNEELARLIKAGDEEAVEAYRAKYPLADKKVPRFLRAIDPAHEALQKYVYRPWATVQGGAYMSSDPGYWMKNRWSNAFHIFVDEGPIPALKAFFRYGPENNEAFLRRTLGFLPESAGEGFGAAGGAQGVKGWGFTRAAALDEQAAAKEVMATSVRRTMRDALKEGRVIPGADMLSEFSPAEQKILVNLAKKSYGNAKETLAAFRSVGASEGWSASRELAFLNDEQMAKLQELRLYDPALDAVRGADSYEDAVRRLDEVLSQYRAVGRRTAGESPALDLSDDFQASLAETSHGLAENLGEEEGDIFVRRNLMRERANQASREAADELEQLAERKVVNEATIEAARQGVPDPARAAANETLDRFRILRNETADAVEKERAKVVAESHVYMDQRHKISDSIRKWNTERIHAHWKSHKWGDIDPSWSRGQLVRETKNRFWRAARDYQDNRYLELHQFILEKNKGRAELMAEAAGVDINLHGLSLEAGAQEARAAMFEGIYLERGVGYVDIPINRLGDAIALRMAKDAGIDPDAAKALIAELAGMEPGEAELFLRQHPEIERALGEVIGFPGSNEADILKRLEARDMLVGSVPTAPGPIAGATGADALARRRAIERAIDERLLQSEDPRIAELARKSLARERLSLSLENPEAMDLAKARNAERTAEEAAQITELREAEIAAVGGEAVPAATPISAVKTEPTWLKEALEHGLTEDEALRLRQAGADVRPVMLEGQQWAYQVGPIRDEAHVFRFDINDTTSRMSAHADALTLSLTDLYGVEDKAATKLGNAFKNIAEELQLPEPEKMLFGEGVQVAAPTEAIDIEARLRGVAQGPEVRLEREGRAALDEERARIAREAYEQRTAGAAWRAGGERTFRMEAVAPADIAAPTPARFHYQTQGEARAAIDELKLGLRENWDELEQVGMTPAKERQLRQWARELQSRATTMKTVATGAAQAARDFTLHNYRERFGIDLLLGYIYPYQFWHSRTYLKWMGRMFTNPAVVASYFKYRNAMDKLHSDLPPWWRYNLNLNELLGIQTENPLYLNLEATLNPVQGLTNVDFNDPQKRLDWWSATADDLNKFGPTMWTPYQLAIAAVYHAQGKNDAAARWAGRGWRPTRTIRDLTALMGMNAGKGIEIDPFVNYFSGGIDPQERARVGRMATSMTGEYSRAEIDEAMRNQTGPIWDEAFKRAIHLRAPNLWMIAAPFFLGTGFKPRTKEDVEIDRFYAEQRALIMRKADMSPEDYSRAWNDLERRYPFRDTLILAKRAGLDRDEAYAWAVLGRLPPGRARALVERVGGKYEMIDAFYDSKGDLAAMSEADRNHFMGVILDLSALLEVPPGATKAEWDEARARYSTVMTRTDIVFGAGTNDLIDQYYGRLGEDKAARDAANAFLDAHPVVGKALDWRQQQVMADPLLSAYYNSFEKTLQYLKRQMYSEAAEKFGKDLWDKWDVYSRLKEVDPKAARSYFKDHPELKEYLDFRDERMGFIEAEANRVGMYIPAARPEVYRADQGPLPMPEVGGTKEDWIQDQVQQYLPEPTAATAERVNLPLALSWGQWSNMVGAPTARILADHYRDGTPVPKAVMTRMEGFAQTMGMSAEELVGLIGSSYGQ